MNITIKINTDNDAFEGNNQEFEVARILNKLAREIEHGNGTRAQNLRDINGNTVGSIELEDSYNLGV